MRFSDYLKDHLISIIVMIAIVFLSGIILWVFNLNTFLIFYIPSLFLLGYIIVFIYNYWRRRNYYNNFIELLDSLDQKYLITELLKQPNFLDGKVMVSSIYEIDKSMKEHINEIRFQQVELKEYIEMWCHEVKTPLATAMMVVENNGSDVNDSIKEELVKIENYLEQVLFYARSENVEKDYLIKEVDLNEIVNTVIKRNKKDLISRKIKIELDNLSIKVHSDKKWLEFILHQIINNAIKYVDKDPLIKITANQYQDHIELLILDNGIGIDENEIDRVFDKGFTGTNGRNHHKSTGIGLYLCKKLCKRLNHEIKIASKNGQTIVTIIFPCNSYLTLQ